MTREKHKKWLIELLSDRSGARDYYLGDEDKKVIVEALEQPAYDVEAVVRELEENKRGFFILDGVTVRTIPLDKAIEIVRGGRNEV